MLVSNISAEDLLVGFPEPTLLIDENGAILYGNPAACEMLSQDGFAENEPVTNFLPEDERSRLAPLDWLKRWAQTPDAPELRYVHLYCRSRDDKLIPVRVRVGRTGDEPVCYVVMLQDVTEEQARQHETRQAHRLAARQLAISADGIINVDDAMQVIYANAAAHELFAAPAGTLVGQNLTDLLPERYRPTHDAFVRRFASESAPSRLMGERAEVVGLRADGTEVPLEASIAKITAGEHYVFSAHLRDLTSRKSADAALNQALTSLQMVFDHALQAMALIRPDGTVQQMNPAARQLLPPDVEPNDQQFATLPFWSNDPAATAAMLGTAMSECLAGRPYRTQADVQLPDGSHRTLDLSLTPVKEQDTVFGVIVEAHELTRVTA